MHFLNLFFMFQMRKQKQCQMENQTITEDMQGDV